MPRIRNGNLYEVIKAAEAHAHPKARCTCRMLKEPEPMSLPDSCNAMQKCMTLLLTHLHMRAAQPAEPSAGGDAAAGSLHA